ncbi:hypothetical protein TI39_contig5873g00001, partial [Zymoseptoria brevis]
MSHPNMASLRLDDDDDDEPTDTDLFASPSNTPAPSTAKPTTATKPTPQQSKPKQSKQDLLEARNAQLTAELARIRSINTTIESVTSSLLVAKSNMSTVHTTVNNASTLLATWTRILSQTEHNQRLVLNPAWQGATRDLEDAENEGLKRQVEVERRVLEEERRRVEEERRREEEERRKIVVMEARGGVGRRGSTRAGARSGYTGV